MFLTSALTTAGARRDVFLDPSAVGFIGATTFSNNDKATKLDSTLLNEQAVMQRAIKSSDRVPTFASCCHCLPVVQSDKHSPFKCPALWVSHIAASSSAGKYGSVVSASFKCTHEIHLLPGCALLRS